MSRIKGLSSTIFSIDSETQFNQLALDVFRFQFEEISTYRSFCELLNRQPDNVRVRSDIPFLPIETFKTHNIYSGSQTPELLFRSSGTTGEQTSQHFVSEPDLYRSSFRLGFQRFVADPASCHIFALLPNYLDRPDSSLIFMVDDLMHCNPNQQGGFYKTDFKLLHERLTALTKNEPVILFGVTFALLEFAKQYPADLSHVTIIETGGMKGKGPEVTRDELHAVLADKLHPKKILSEYGMTELLSQAYCLSENKFTCPPWMRVMIRDVNDPFNYVTRATGAINIIDLANIYSCSFLATSDLGKEFDDGRFEVLGRLDYSDMRGCNLLFDL